MNSPKKSATNTANITTASMKKDALTARNTKECVTWIF